MPFVVADRVRETTTSTGTGTITLSGTAPTGFQTFGTGIGNANNTFYTIAGGSEWEVGIGTYTAVGTTLSRDTVLASSAGGTTKVTFSAGTKDVFVTYPAGRSVYQEGSFNAALGSVTAPSHSFVGDTNTGMFSPAADTIAFAEGGVEAMRITSAGDVGIGTTAPGAKLDVVSAGTVFARVQNTASTADAYLSTQNTLGTGLFGVNATGQYMYTAQAIPTLFYNTGLERMRIDSAGQVGIGATASAGTTLRIGKNLTGATLSIGTYNNQTIQSDVTSTAQLFSTFSSTAAAAFTLGSLHHYSASLNTIGASSAITTQAGFFAQSTLIGATNNYGFLGSIPSGTGRWNLYMGGTAANYLEGSTGIGTATPGAKLHVAGGSMYITGSGTYTEPAAIAGVFAFDSTNGDLNISARSNGGNTFTRFFTSSGGAGAERMRITSAGDVGIGTTTPGAKLHVVGGNIAVDATNRRIGYITDGTASNTGYMIPYDASGFLSLHSNFSAGGIKLHTGTSNTERMRITVAGDVGINTAAPGALLGVAGATLIGNQASTGTAGSLRFISTGGVSYIQSGQNTTSASAAPLAFTDMNASGEWMRITSTGNVGIGTTNPGARFHVNGAAKVGEGAASNSSKLMVNTLSGVAAGIQLFQDANESWVIQNPATSTVLTFSASGAERMRITSAGIVGVGTTAPASYSTRFAVVGGNIGVSEDGATVTTIRGNANVSNIGAFNATGASLTFSTAPSGSGEVERMRITSTGNVGIGTASPGTPLDVTGTTRSGNFRVNSGGSVAGSGMWGTDTALAFNTNSNERMRIDSTGNVGVGTGSPNALLHVSFSPPASIPALGSGAGALALGPAANYGMLLGTNSSGTGYIQQQRFDGTATVYPLVLQPNGGNVGIGTSSVSGKLDVVGGATQRKLQVSGSAFTDTVADVFISRTGTNSVGLAQAPSLQFGNATDASGVILQGSNQFQIFTNNAGAGWIERMRVSAVGDVGVGTGSPVNYSGFTTLDIDNATNGGLLNIKKAGTTVGYINGSSGMLLLANATPLTLSATGSNQVQFVTNATERMRVTGAGDVGIGTAAPQSKFQVSTGYIIAGSASSTAGARIIGGDYSGSDHITTFGSEFSSGGPVIGYGVWPSTAAALSFVSSAAPALQRAAYTQSGNNHVWFTGASQTVAVGSAVTMTERMRLDGSGNIGIGTAPSGVRLDVNGSIRTTVGSGGTLTLFETDATRANQLLSGADASGSFINATFSTGGSAVLRIQTANVERMRVDASGNVAIGTASAASRLTVAGTTAITWAASGTSSGLVTIGDQGTSGSSLFLNTPSLNSSFASGFGVDGSYTNPGGVGTSIINLKAFGVNSGGGYGSDMAFHTAVGSTLSEKFRITSTGAITSSNLADAVGYKGLPQNSQTASYTLALSDMGKHISITTGGVVIPANGSVAFPIGSAVTIFNDSGSNQTISITTDTLRQAGTANTGSRTLAQYGVATVLKVTSTVWVISGAGVS